MTASTFSVILADPPWRYKNFSDSAHGAAVAHYDGMTEEELRALPVLDWGASDSVLFMWATWPKLDEAMRIVPAWGFDYVTAIPWVKVLPAQREIYRGIGFWAMAASEVLLIARRGEPKRAGDKHEHGMGAIGAQIGLMHGEPRIFYAPRTQHSTKPLEVHEWIERLFPDASFLELFARRERPGWTTWGNELGFKLSETGVERCALPAAEPLPLFDAPPAPAGAQPARRSS